MTKKGVMHKIYFTCGPSQLYPTVQKHIYEALAHDIPSISHRGAKFQEIFQKTVVNLKRLLAVPKQHHIFFLSSSLESMERIIENCVETYSFHFVNGSFSKKFYEIAIDVKRKPEKVKVEEGEGFDFSNVRIPKKTELIAITHNETSTGVSVPLQDISTLSQAYPEMLIAVDTVSSAPYVNLDFSQVDIAFFSVQKGFGLPAGMGVLIVNERAMDKARFLKKRGVNVGSYHSFSSLLEKAENYQTPETPNVLEMYLLQKVTDDLLKKAITTIRKETEKKAKLIYDFFDQHPRYKPFVKEKKFRSKTTLVIDVKGDTKKILVKLAEKGFIVSSGYGKFKEEHIRIANFPSHKIQDIKQLLKRVET